MTALLRNPLVWHGATGVVLILLAKPIKKWMVGVK